MPAVRVRYRKDRQRWESDLRAYGAGRPTFATEEEANEHMAKAILEHNREQKRTRRVPRRNIPLRAYVEEVWAPSARKHYAAATWRSYDANLTKHVLPILGNEPVRAITRGDVKRMITQKDDEGWVKGGKRYVYSTDALRIMRASLSVVLADAVDDDLLKVNPCLDQGGGRRRQADRKTKSEATKSLKPFDLEEAGKLIETWAGTRYGALFELIMYTGLRPGEAYALRPEDVDLDQGKLAVERAIDEQRKVKDTKTHERRVVDLDSFPRCLPFLENYIGKLGELALEKGHGDWLFMNEVGGLLDHAKVRKEFKRQLRTASIRDRGPYNLRHTFASMMLSNGAPLLYVSNQMGHANAETTLRYYARWIPDTKTFGTKTWNQGVYIPLPSEVTTE